MNSSALFVTGIGTGVGKTVVSAILAEALKAVYWKPIQAGDLDNSDTIKVSALTDNVTVLDERFKLTEAMSPHAAADIDKVKVSCSDFSLPETNGRPLIVEGAGGLLVPLNSEENILNLIQHLSIPVVVVSQNYLGSINHTLLTIQVLKSADIPVKGIIFNGPSVTTTEDVILGQTGVDCIGRVPSVVVPDKKFIGQQAKVFRGIL